MHLCAVGLNVAISIFIYLSARTESIHSMFVSIHPAHTTNVPTYPDLDHAHHHTGPGTHTLYLRSWNGAATSSLLPTPHSRGNSGPSSVHHSPICGPFWTIFQCRTCTMQIPKSYCVAADALFRDASQWGTVRLLCSFVAGGSMQNSNMATWACLRSERTQFSWICLAKHPRTPLHGPDSMHVG